MSAFISAKDPESEGSSETEHSKGAVTSKKSISPHKKMDSDLRLNEKGEAYIYITGA
jgi:hypothetical protein